MTTETLNLLLPEIVLIAAATLIFMAGAFVPRRLMPNLLAAVAIVLAAAVMIWQDCHENAALFGQTPWARISGPLAVDLFGHVSRWGILLFGLLLAMTAAHSPSVRPAAEYAGSLLLILAGLMIVATGYDLAILFLGLELVSIPTYVMLYLGRRGPLGQEATAKYFFLSILSSALLLYGFSFLYGAAGSTRLDHLFQILRPAFGSQPSQFLPQALKLAPIGLLLVFAGMGFRMTLVPFHFYAPDVYQGTSNTNAGLLATLPKVAGLLVLVRLVFASMPGMEMLGWKIALVLSVLTMTLGNVLALWQDNIRRLLAYSSIAHGGYILIGLSVGLAHDQHFIGGKVFDKAEGGIKIDGVGTAIFYLTVYCLATLGAFAALKYLGHDDHQVDGLDELSGLGRTRPLPALALAVSMFSLAGIPPLAGFWGKLTLFIGALGVDSAGTTNPAESLRPWFLGLAIIGVVNAAIALAYYLRVVAAMYFRSSITTLKAGGGPGALWSMVACMVLDVGLGCYPGPFIDITNRAARALRQVQPQEIKITLPNGSLGERAPTGPVHPTS
jgi:NADH-quinone oxidoreductase subunit N